MHIHQKLILCLLALSGAIWAANTPNLLTGDADVEISPAAMTSGPWSNSFPDKPRWSWQENDGFASSSCIRVTEFAGIACTPVNLQPGEYTFSFMAKGETEEATAYIMVNPQSSTWTDVLTLRSKNAITVTTEWKQYTYTFKVEKEGLYSAYYGTAKSTIRFDRFMLNAGNAPKPWCPTSPFAIAIQLPPNNGNVIKIGNPVDINVKIIKYTEDNPGNTLKVNIIDYVGTEIRRESFPIAFDKEGTFNAKITAPGHNSGWFRITAQIDDTEAQWNSYVITREPEPTITEVEPFTGLVSAEQFLQAAQLIGIKWLQPHIFWPSMENAEGKYNLDFSKWQEYKNMGFKLQCMVGTSAPQWAMVPLELEKSNAMKISYHRFLPNPQLLETSWKNLFREYFKKYKGLMDIYELGGELDALIGLNTYYKSMDTENVLHAFVLGEYMERMTKQLNIAAEEILAAEPNARISAVRPSDVDSRYDYAYSRKVFEKCGKNLNCFGIDCYPQPRWIGPGQPMVGTEQDLTKRYNDSVAAMEGLVTNKGLMISEYGYFIDFAEIQNLHWLRIHLNRLARSFLKARAVGFKSLHWYTTNSSSLEGKRYHMGIWYRSKPLPAVAAMNAVARVVENVNATNEPQLSSNIGAAVFRKVDGRAVAALWQINDGEAPKVAFDHKDFQLTDVMGNPLPNAQQGTKIVLKLSDCPVYIWSNSKNKDNYAILSQAINNAIVTEGLPCHMTFRMASQNSLKLYVKNNSLQKDCIGTANYDCDGIKGTTAPTVAPKGQTAIMLFPLPKPGKSLSATVNFEGYEPVQLHFTTPDILIVPRTPPLPIDGNINSWKHIPPVTIGDNDHIHPVDHTTYSGMNDLSANLRLAYDDQFIYFSAEVTDDSHFNKFENNQIWKGDSMQIAMDPEMNCIKKENGLDPDDSLVTVGLLSSGPALAVNISPDKNALQQNIAFTVTRDDKTRKTIYMVKFPFKSAAPKLKPGDIFGFNCITFDDDSNAGADYWLFLKQGLGGGHKPDKFQPCMLAE